LLGSPEKLREVRSLHTRTSYVNKPLEHSAHTSQDNFRNEGLLFWTGVLRLQKCARNNNVRRFVNSMFEIHPLKRGLLQNVMTIIINGDQVDQMKKSGTAERAQPWRHAMCWSTGAVGRFWRKMVNGPCCVHRSYTEWGKVRSAYSPHTGAGRQSMRPKFRLGTGNIKLSGSAIAMLP